MDTPAENTVVVCDTISRITKMLPVLQNCHFGSFVPCSEQNVHPLPVSDAGPFAHFCAKVLSSKKRKIGFASQIWEARERDLFPTCGEFATE